MDTIYWYNIGSNSDKVISRLYNIVDFIDLYNASKKGKYEIYYGKVYIINRDKTTIDGKKIIRNWLQISFSDDNIINSKMLRKYIHKLYNMDEFLNKKSYHKNWKKKKWKKYEIDDLLTLD
jgi:hypothetical protein